MFCRNCGQKLADGDKFCSACGTRTQAAENPVAETVAASVEEISPAASAEDKPLFEPFDFKAFGFDFADLGLGTGAKKEETAEESKPTPPTEKFDWNTGAFPDTNKTAKTEDINFNWSLSPETPEPAAEPEVFKAEEPVWTEPAETTGSELEAELFGDIESKADETRKQSEEIDKFFTFHKKNEEFQKILDREYEKVKTGNIITEEISAADAVSEEKFVSRQPADPMEEMFAEAGVIKGYEPKPVETDVLERIEAAEAEKRIQEEAARLADEKRAAMAAEAVEEPVEAAETVEPVESAEETAAVEAAPVAEEPAAEPEEPAVEELQTIDVVEEELVVEEPVQEDAPEKTKQVDKAAILAEIALASEMVERDRALAAAQEAEAIAAAEAIAEAAKVALPDFLGHQNVEEAAAVDEITLGAPVVEEILAEQQEETEEPAVEGEPAVEPVSVAEIIEEAAAEEAAEEPAAETVIEEAAAAEEPVEEVEIDIFEQLEELETPAEEIVLKEPQTIEDLFAEIPTVETEAEEETVTAHTVVLTEDSVAEILKTVEEDTTKDDTMVFTAHALGALLAEAEQTDPDASEVVVSLEELTSLEQQAAEGTLPPVGAVAEEIEDEEEVQGGKGRTFLKICLVILVILLVIEIAGVAIKIVAPTSGANDFIDKQLNKVFQLIGDEDTDPENYNA